MTWKDAIIQVFRNNKVNGKCVPMYYRDITDNIFESGLKETTGKTPAFTVSAQLSKNPNLFEALGEGVYRLIEKGKDDSKKSQDKDSKDVKINSLPKLPLSQEKLIANYGMYWMRDGINWDNCPKLLGTQSSGSVPIDLSEMRGIYMLYDGREVIYVGQAAEQPILKRLIQHTKNRLSTRWNRFSWFGIDKINSEGKIIKTENQIITDLSSLIHAFEGILIEGLEPRQNRQQGNNFGIEYYQEMDKNVVISKLISHIQKY